MKYRDHLPQLGGDLFLTDGGIETVLIFHEGLDLPEFAAFDLLKDEEGTERLRSYYAPYVALARERGVGFVLESPTWRASPRWAEEIGYDRKQLNALNRKAIALLEEIRDEQDAGGPPIVISGCVGPHDDGYNPAELLTAEAAQEYHSTQIGTFAGTAADMVTAITMTYADEAIGIVRAAAGAGLAAVISRSHAELDEAEELDEGDPADLGARYAELREHLPRLCVLGGCCGTDHRHVAEIRDAWLAKSPD